MPGRLASRGAGGNLPDLGGPGGSPGKVPGARLDWPRGHMAAIGRENYLRAILMRCSFVKRTYLGHY